MRWILNIFYIYAAAEPLCGETVTGIRFFTACYAMLTVLAVFLTARKIAGSKSGLAAALLYGVYSTFFPTQGGGSNTEIFMVLPLTASMYFFCCAAEENRARNLVLTGVCTGIAMLIKTVAIAHVTALGLILLVPWCGKTAKGIAKDLACYLLPMVLMGAALLATSMPRDASPISGTGT